ncbi:DUF2937 family protein [Shewanella yunxiaonensis]|uniref:DUF2937 family protein n=1 Tax=Shewanella yunxiaonensis TaxID=2829809 RepID=A0ABX7YT95_9GAMM|nr:MULTISPECIES: DUF2937 family protein [Shewanella]MDF0534639.1 DUF2937 family protein [Shewanella sp. A32]QUN05987.1 DUF2937 family protein [Shewanella yunxiaonensis]
MLKMLRDYLRLLLFFTGTLAGLQVPGFVDQYGKSLQAHLAEAKQQLAGFQQDADRYFGGNLEQLIAHYAASPDPIFSAGGNNVSTMAQRQYVLQDAWQRFNKAIYTPYTEILLHPLPDIRQEVWQHYSHNVLLKPDAMAFGLVSGLLLAMLTEALLSLIWLLCRLPFRRRLSA